MRRGVPRRVGSRIDSLFVFFDVMDGLDDVVYKLNVDSRVNRAAFDV